MILDIHIRNWAPHGEYIADDISYWVPLMNYFFSQADSIEIHCWTEEEAVNDEIRQEFPELAVKRDKYMTIYKGVLSDRIMGFLTRNPTDEAGQIKWFSIFLTKDGTQLFTSAHFGTELHVHHVSEEQIQFIKSLMPDVTDFCLWD